MKSIKLTAVLLFLSLSNSWGQDPQFSQFYNTSLISNPAFTGSADCYRAGITARSQWVGLKRAFNTSLAYLDFNYRDYNSGIGFYALYDDIGVADLASVELSALYSYTVDLGKYGLKLGVQGSYVNRSIDYSRIVFEDQFSPELDIFKDLTDDPVSQFNQVNYVDFSSGLLFFRDNRYWLGFSAHHLNRPDQAFQTSDDSRLPIKYTIQAGYKFEREFKTMTKVDKVTFYPSILYKSQGAFDQADYGFYAYFNKYMFGMFYRGIFFKEFETERNNDALTTHLGYHYKQWEFYYSYDLTTSRIRQRNTFGSHEVALVYKFCADWPKLHTPPKNSMMLPCPEFDDRSNPGTLRRHKKRQIKQLKKKRINF